MELVFTLIFVAVFIFYQYVLFQRKVRELPIPGPKPVPFLGNLPQMDLRTSMWRQLIAWFNQYGGVIQVFFSTTRVIVIGDPAVAKIFFNEDKFRKVARFPELGKTNIVASNGEEWSKLRRVCNSAFNVSHFRIFAEPMRECIDSVVSILEKNTSTKELQKTVNLDDIFVSFTLDVIAKTMFSEDLQAINNGGHIFTHSLAAYLQEAYLQYVNKYRWLIHPTSTLRRARAAKGMSQFVDDVIARRVAKRNSSDYDSSQAKDLLDLLLDAHDPKTGEGLTLQEIKDQVIMFFVAGHETTAHTIAFTIASIASNPKVAEKIREELDLTFGKGGIPKEYQDTQKLPYVTAVIKETMRMYPIAADLTRELAEDTMIGGYDVPKGTRIVLGIIAIHFNEKVWKNPTVFDPERFMNGHDEESSANLMSHIPFGFGRRICLGQHFAMMEMRLVISTLIRQFDFAHLPLNPLSVHQTLTLRPASGLKMFVWPRGEVSSN